MTKKKIAREKRDWTANWRLLPGLACLALLAGCGGGGDGSDTATAQDATKQIAAAVPGSWTGRVPGSEVINGITVPPEPSPTLNNATLAGVDANKNGVRDDVERKLAKQIEASIFSTVVIAARSYQNVLISPPKDKQSAIAVFKIAYCLNVPSEIELNILRWTFDTQEREYLLNDLQSKAGAFFGSELEGC